MAALFLSSAPGGGDRLLSDAPHRFGGVAPGGRAGWAIASAGDVDGDGLGDFILGSPMADPQASNSGVAHLVTGADLGVLGDHWLEASSFVEFAGMSNTAGAGQAVAPLGDLDGDGLDDFVISAPDAYNWSPGTAGPGTVFVLLAE